MEKRFPVKIMERTHEEATEALHAGRSWRRRGNNDRFAASRPREKAKTLVSGRFRVTDEVDYFRIADGPEVL
jgi:hypothetical protein